MKKTLGILLVIYGVVVLLMVSSHKAEDNKSDGAIARTTIIK